MQDNFLAKKKTSINNKSGVKLQVHRIEVHLRSLNCLTNKINPKQQEYSKDQLEQN